MSQSTTGNSVKKRNYASPQKTQTSIAAYTNQKSQKKLNNNITPTRTAITRSQEAILGLKSPPNANKNLTLSNNPYSALSLEEDDLESSQESPSETGILQEPNRLLKGTDTDTVSTKTSTKTVETESSNTSLSSQEKVLLSRKTQQALRKLRSARKALTDLSIREELEEVYGVEDASQLVDTTLDQALKPLVGKDEVEKGTNHMNQEQEDMIIDNEDDNTPKDDGGKDGTARISSIGDGSATPL